MFGARRGNSRACCSNDSSPRRIRARLVDYHRRRRDLAAEQPLGGFELRFAAKPMVSCAAGLASVVMLPDRGVAGSVIDITERKAAEEGMRLAAVSAFRALPKAC